MGWFSKTTPAPISIGDILLDTGPLAARDNQYFVVYTTAVVQQQASPETASVQIEHVNAPVNITSSAADDQILTAAPHGLAPGDTVVIAGHTGSTPAINGQQVVNTVPDSTHFTLVGVDITVGGTGGTLNRIEKDPDTGLLHVHSQIPTQGNTTTKAIGERDFSPGNTKYAVPVLANDRIRVRAVSAITAGNVVCTMTTW